MNEKEQANSAADLRITRSEERPFCGKCHITMTPQNSTKRPELFLCDRCVDWALPNTLPGNIPDSGTIETGSPESQSSTNVATRQNHCKDCCCAQSWIALGVDSYTGKSIPEHISELRHKPDVHREPEIIAWGEARNICGPNGQATTRDQWRKTKEECRELARAIVTDNHEAAKDAIGDIVVTLIMQAQMWEFTMAECIEAAWQQIKNRTGRMENGIFVKDEKA